MIIFPLKTRFCSNFKQIKLGVKFVLMCKFKGIILLFLKTQGTKLSICQSPCDILLLSLHEMSELHKIINICHLMIWAFLRARIPLVRMLDILEKFLIRKGYAFSRLDGSTPTNLRQSLVDDFNSSPSKQVSFHIKRRLNKLVFFLLLDSLLFSGVPYINSSWRARIESCEC